ncbi:MAG: 4-alpha-glucanotransferase [Opitutales bacterium]
MSKSTTSPAASKKTPEPWLTQRASGVLLHPTSLPSPTGVGNFGTGARRFVDFLAASGFRYWQMCPLSPTGFGDSPYQCFSAFAGNAYLIDLEALVPAGLLSHEELAPLHALPDDFADYEQLHEPFWEILDRATERFLDNPRDLEGCGTFADFKHAHAAWLDAYAAYIACKAYQKGAPWYEWPLDVRSYAKFKDSKLAKQLAREMEAMRFVQYVFAGQWQQLRAYASQRGIGIIGDAPIFVALDSADVWEHPELFQLDAKTLKPTYVAGVPPDYFSETGQMWGNPLYAWEAHEKDSYAWWIRRLKANFETFDIVRIDHFIGFQNYWRIPADADDARSGKWVPGPGKKFFDAVANALPGAQLIAEDLGILTDEVKQLRDDCGFPGMAVLHFAFGGDADNPYLPHNHKQNQVVYPGTHDNDTTLGWYGAEADHVTDHFRRYFETDGAAPQWTLLKTSLKSPARLAVVVLQDLMNLGTEARLNTPGTALGNWQWRYQPDQLNRLWSDSGEYLKYLNQLYGRLL